MSWPGLPDDVDEGELPARGFVTLLGLGFGLLVSWVVADIHDWSVLGAAGRIVLAIVGTLVAVVLFVVACEVVGYVVTMLGRVILRLWEHFAGNLQKWLNQ